MPKKPVKKKLTKELLNAYLDECVSDVARGEGVTKEDVEAEGYEGLSRFEQLKASKSKIKYAPKGRPE